MTDTPLLRLARLMLRFVGNESSNDADSLNLRAKRLRIVCDDCGRDRPAVEVAVTGDGWGGYDERRRRAPKSKEASNA